ncbi:MAG: EamA family transporter [Candidatus Atribacteria bacterium]|nr:EamA family transporter [Candidatus Atribacteria bacterium]
MNPIAIILVIISAFIHSFWNLLAKKSKNKLVFNWYIILFGPVLYLPLFLYFVSINQTELQPIGWLFIILSALFHTFYFYFLGKTYSYGHLSLTYPIVRSSPLFVPLLAFLLIREKLSFVGISGIIIILIGIYLLHLRSISWKSFLEPLKYMKGKATTYAFSTALFSAFYSVNDKMGVRCVQPFIYIYITWIVLSIFYLPIIFFKNNRKDIKFEWKDNKKSILISAFLVLFSYLLTLFAFTIDKVSYIVSLRQLSAVFGVILGTFVLKEKYGKIRLFASIIMFIGFFLVIIA